ncbi:helix-turn-helix domain-containing protein [Olivibacter sp. XZL3]|uniref:helix-turn-helix domain-containing protein n=1 Tax=Olivibacter sp. XZL3 TaxID=1735116 RepID=UPI001064D696|nr:helix-turn-helix domain-containing protein [Olivibacter sp. XZL3]
MSRDKIDVEYFFRELPEAIEELHKKIDRLSEHVKAIQNQSDHVPESMDVEQAANFLNIAVRTVYDKVYKRQLPAYKKGKNLYFYKEELYSYIASGKLKTHEEIKREAEAYIKTQKLNLT